MSTEVQRLAPGHPLHSASRRLRGLFLAGGTPKHSSALPNLSLNVEYRTLLLAQGWHKWTRWQEADENWPVTRLHFDMQGLKALTLNRQGKYFKHNAARCVSSKGFAFHNLNLATACWGRRAKAV